MAAADRPHVMQRTATLVHVPDYEPRETARSRLSKLAVAALLLSLLASPLVLRFLPYSVVTLVIRTAGIGTLILALPAALCGVVSLVTLRHLRRHGPLLIGLPLVVAALVVNTVSMLVYVVPMIIFSRGFPH